MTTNRPDERAIGRFLAEHELPDSYRRLIDAYLLPLVDWVSTSVLGSGGRLLGINGAQGTGKTTLADFLELSLETGSDRRVAVLSIDDFYLTRDERLALARERHPLFATRGVPGTHDVAMLDDAVTAINALGPGESLRLPRFDKARDDRAPESGWPEIVGPVDLVILEGWCVGSTPQAAADLDEPVNELERIEDADGRWRHYANERLASDYARLFARLDALVFLAAPSFEAIHSWRLEQERKLAAAESTGATAIMDDARLADFIRHFERITRHNLEVLGRTADVVLEFDRHHDCIGSTGLFPTR